MPNLMMLNFISVTLMIFVTQQPICSAQFTVQPESVVQAEGLEAVFQCLYPGAPGHIWGINGNFPSAADFPDDFTRTSSSGDTPATLTIPALPQYNNTVVQCEAIFDEGDIFSSILSENATLLLQGLLELVTNAHFNETASSMSNITISWSAPFSLDLTTADPDIQYCVEVYNVTGGGSHHLDSVCGITDTQYTYTAPDPTGVYSFTVTPRSNIQGSLNGTTSQQVEGYTIQMPVVIPAHEIDLIVNVDANPVDLEMEFALSVIEFPGSRPTSYTMGLEFLDGTLSSPCNCNTTHVVRNGMVVLEDVDCTPYIISRHTIFNLSLVTHNSVGSSTSDPLEISTHDTQVQDVVYSNELEQVVVNCSYLEGSQDVGFLLIVSSESGFNYGVVYREEGEEFTAVAINGTEGSRVLVYDLQNNNLIESKPATVEPLTAVRGETLQVPSLANAQQFFVVEFTSNGHHICLSCNTDTCVGIIHSLDLYFFNLTSLSYSPDSGPNCTDGPLQGNLSAVVFGLSNGRLNESPSYQANITVDNSPGGGIEHIIAAIIAVVLGIILSTTFVCMHMKRKKQYSYSPNVSRDSSSDHVSEDVGNFAIQVTDFTSTPIIKSHHLSQAEPPPQPYDDLEDVPPAQDVDDVHVPVRQPTPSTCTSLVGSEKGVFRNIFRHRARSCQSSMTDIYSPSVRNHIPLFSVNKDVQIEILTSENTPSVMYAENGVNKLAPRDKNSEAKREPAPPRALPSPPSAESILAEIHPVCSKWEELGEALGVPEHVLDNISTEGSDPVRLHEVMVYHFSRRAASQYSWEEIVRALQDIGETEAADKIVRSGKAKEGVPSNEVSANEVSGDSCSPPVPPRPNGKLPAAAQESGPADSCIVVATESVAIIEDDNEDGLRKQENGIKQFTRVISGDESIPKPKSRYTGNKSQPSDANQESDTCLSGWSCTSYNSQLALSLNLFGELSPKQTAKAVRTLVTDQLYSSDLVQRKMEGLAEAEENCIDNTTLPSSQEESGFSQTTAISVSPEKGQSLFMSDGVVATKMFFSQCYQSAGVFLQSKAESINSALGQVIDSCSANQTPPPWNISGVPLPPTTILSFSNWGDDRLIPPPTLSCSQGAQGMHSLLKLQYALSC